MLQWQVTKISKESNDPAGSVSPHQSTNLLPLRKYDVLSNAFRIAGERTAIVLNDILDNKAKSFAASDSAHGKQQCQYLSAEIVAETKAC
jgi:hypothetical protein